MATKDVKCGFLMLVLLMVAVPSALPAQSTTGTISGTVFDPQRAVVPGAMVTTRNLETNITRSVTTNETGRFRMTNLPVGTYEVSVEIAGFSRYVRSGITLALNQDAVVEVALQPAAISETVTVIENAPALNVTNSEVGVQFDAKRISELPLNPGFTGGGTLRNVYSLALSAPGVSELGRNQMEYSSGVNYAANGMRLRSNNIMVDGQDTNEPGVTGRAQALNNPDIVQEVRLITNQFSAEYGRNSGSIMNVVTKSGANEFHGTAFWFHNDNALNSLSNLEKAAGQTKTPFRIENQVGGSLGGPIVHDRTFFFGSYQRWANRRQGTGNTLRGAPTEAGRTILQNVVGNRPQVAALLKHLPPAQSPIGQSVPFTVGGTAYQVPIGSLTGSAARKIDDDQFSIRIDHQLAPMHSLGGRYLLNDELDSGAGQVTPPGLTTLAPTRQQAASIWLTSTLSNSMVNEVRTSYQRYGTSSGPVDSSSLEIPSIEINELGLVGFNQSDSRTGIGLAINLPQYRYNNIYQIQDTLSLIKGNHALKFGADLRRSEVATFFVPIIRGRLAYSTLQRFVDDVADAATINRPLPGGSSIQYYKWYDTFLFAQDEWKLTPAFTLTYGLRYELPGNTVDDLVEPNTRIVAAAGGDQRFLFGPVPKSDRNNLQPRVGFNWNPRTSTDGVLGVLTGGDKFVLRGGYARTNDYAFLNVNINIASAFPFVASLTLPSTPQPGGVTGVSNAFAALATAQGFSGDPMLLTRTVVGDNFRSPSADQFSLEVQREVTRDFVFRVGYIGTKGTGLFQTLDGNPRLPFSTTRVDPTRGVIRVRANAASSIYHSLQMSMDKRLSENFSAGVHYTWSSFIDDASDIFNPSTGEVAVPQDSFNRSADRGRSSYDRPHRVAGNFVYELPVYRDQAGPIGRLLGGWQLNSFFTFQSGAPFTALNGADPTGALSGIDALLGSAIRPNLNTALDVSGMSVPELRKAGGRSLFSQLTAGQRTGNIGRNTLRADGINNVDLGIIKNTRVGEDNTVQFRVEMFNFTNTRNFGIPEGRVNSPNFLDQWATEGGSRRLVMALRYQF
jgi:hypothetical protein